MALNTKKLDPKKTIFLIDGSSVLYRGYYGMRALHTSKGVPVQAVYTFCRMIKKLIDTFKPLYIVIVWDPKGKTTRHEVYEDYKATRQAPPSDLFEQKDKIVEFADLIGIAQVMQEGIEADDLMYSIAKEREKEGDTSIFVTSDKDMGQAVSDHILMFDLFKDIFYDKPAFEEKMGFPVAKLPFYYGLLGDISDNIPGVRGIGKKTAFELMQEFNSIEDLYNRIDEVQKTRVKTALLANKDNAFLSRDLFLLQYHPSGLTKKDLAFDANNWKNALPLFKELEFKTLYREAGLTVEEREASIEEKIEHLKKYNFKTVATSEDLDELVAELKAKKTFAIDTETTGLGPLRVDLVGLSFCTQEGTAYYVPCGHNTDEQQLPLEEVITALKPILENPKYKKYLHNAKFDQLVLVNHGIEMQGVACDSMIAANLVTKDWQRVGLRRLSIFYFDEDMLTFQELVKKNKLKNFSYVPIELATYYSGHDAHQTYRLSELLIPQLKKEKMDKLYYDIELPLMHVLYAMEREGIFLDTKILAKLDKEVTKALTIIEGEIIALIPVEKKTINLNSLHLLTFYQTTGKEIGILEVFRNIENNMQAIQDEKDEAAMELIVPDFDPAKFLPRHAEKVCYWFAIIRAPYLKAMQERVEDSKIEDAEVVEETEKK